MFRLTLPTRCPPPTAIPAEQIAYRIVGGQTLTDSDMMSYAEIQPDRYRNICKAHGVSLFGNKADAVRAFRDAQKRNKILGTHLAKLKIQRHDGYLESDPKGSHYTVWFFSTVSFQNITVLNISPIEG